MSTSRAQLSLCVPDLQNYTSVFFGLCCLMQELCVLSLPFCSLEAWMRGVTMSSCSNSTNKSSRHWTLGFLCWAEPVQHLGSLGSQPSAVCVSPSSLIPWAASNKGKGEVRNISLFFPFLFALNVLPRSAEGHSLKGTEKLNHWFSPMKVLRCWILWRIHSFKCCYGRQRANEYIGCCGNTMRREWWCREQNVL